MGQAARQQMKPHHEDSKDTDVVSGLRLDTTWGSKGGHRASFSERAVPSFMVDNPESPRASPPAFLSVLCASVVNLFV